MSARIESTSFPPSRWLHRFAVLTSASTLFLIFVGGLVTSTGSALAVPDWPLAYGSLFPKMVGGVFYEHGHRMVAATVGLLMAALACWIFARERRRWVGWLAACALGTVVLQGVLGGITVLFLLPTAVSVAHACLAQAFFCLTVTLAVVTGSRWMTMPASPAAAPATAATAATAATDDPTLRRLTIALTGSVYLQLILGAVMRHTGAGLAIPDFPLAFGRLVPPLTSPLVAIHFAHRVWAACVTAIMVWTVWRVMSRHRGSMMLVRPALAAMALLIAQISLGALTIWTSKAVLPTTAHVACGAAILAASLVLCLRSHRIMHMTGLTAAGLDPRHGLKSVATRASLSREVTAP